jgi:Protein of unknown function (DUF1573)
MKISPAMLLACFCSTALAGIEWEQTEIALTAKTTDNHVDAVFRFKNTGKKTVTLKDAEATCDCVAASADLRAYKPGESGEISATFYVENHSGENRKGIDVRTDDPDEPQRTLFFTVFVGDTMVLTPTLLKWRVGAEADSQSIHAVVTRDAPLRIVSVRCGGGWTATVREVKEGREYFINVTPPATGRRASTKLTITTDAEEEGAKIFTAGAAVE